MTHRLCSSPTGGHWLALGIGLGASLGVALDHLATGVALGAAFGLVMRVLSARKGDPRRSTPR